MINNAINNRSLSEITSDYISAHDTIITALQNKGVNAQTHGFLDFANDINSIQVEGGADVVKVVYDASTMTEADLGEALLDVIDSGNIPVLLNDNKIYYYQNIYYESNYVDMEFVSFEFDINRDTGNLNSISVYGLYVVHEGDNWSLYSGNQHILNNNLIIDVNYDLIHSEDQQEINTFCNNLVRLINGGVAPDICYIVDSYSRLYYRLDNFQRNSSVTDMLRIYYSDINVGVGADGVSYVQASAITMICDTYANWHIYEGAMPLYGD